MLEHRRPLFILHTAANSPVLLGQPTGGSDRLRMRSVVSSHSGVHVESRLQANSFWVLQLPTGLSGETWKQILTSLDSNFTSPK